MITWECPLCGAKLRTSPTNAGKQGSCKSCGGKVVVPGPSPAANAPSVTLAGKTPEAAVEIILKDPQLVKWRSTFELGFAVKKQLGLDVPTSIVTDTTPGKVPPGPSFDYFRRKFGAPDREEKHQNANFAPSGGASMPPQVCYIYGKLGVIVGTTDGLIWGWRL